jgi:hypothetical protein
VGNKQVAHGFFYLGVFMLDRIYDLEKNKKDIHDAGIEILGYLKDTNKEGCDIYGRLFSYGKITGSICHICLVYKECSSCSRAVVRQKALELYTKLVKPQLEFDF